MSVQRCGACGATVRGGASWCSLCYADLTAAPAAVETQVALRTPVRASGMTAAGDAHENSVDGKLTWPCLICRAQNPYDQSLCGGCGAAFLGGLPAGSGEHRDGALSRLSRGMRLALAGLAALIVTAVAAGSFLLLAITGH